MPRSGRIRSGGGCRLLCFLLPQQVLLMLVLLLLSPGRARATDASGYDEALARRLIVYCSIAISEPEEVDAWTFPNPLCNKVVARDQLIHTFRARDTAYAYVVRNDYDRYFVAAFKGSNDTLDWVDHDLRSSPFKYHRRCTVDKASGATLPGHVHHGLCTYWADLASLGMADTLLGLTRAHPDYTLFVTGHSLGGAAAALCSADMLYRFNVSSTLYTFGEPRVGDHEFAKILTEGLPGRSFRVVHQHDLVPHLGICCGREFGNISCLPLPTCPFHHNSEIFYDNHLMLPGGRYKVCADEEDLSCSNSLRDVAFSVREHERYFGWDVSTLCRWTPPCEEEQLEWDWDWGWMEVDEMVMDAIE